MGSDNDRNGGGSSSSSSPSPTKSGQYLLPPPISTGRSSSPVNNGSLRRSPSSSLLYTPPVIYTSTPLPLHITVRFNAALPDLHLDILNPQQTTVVLLKHLIRSQLAADAKVEKASDTAADDESGDTAPDAPPLQDDKPKPLSPAATAARGRLRFIHAGKILPDGAVLSSVLKAPPPPPPASPQSPGWTIDRKGKGVEGRGPSQQQRVYVSCSIGDELSAEDLAAEAIAAAAPPPSPSLPPARSASSGGDFNKNTLLDTYNNNSDRFRSASSHRNTPRGFDRLLTAGFTPGEVNSLRLQFRSIHAVRHTPDTMPSPDTLLRFEDAWIDNNPSSNNGQNFSSNNNNTTIDEGAGGNGADDDNYGLNAVADGMIKGMFIGFVFPLGAIGWLLREEGIWSKRWTVFVYLGVLLSVSVGVIRALSGDL
ncbi:DUF2407 C-terminal domain-containing protein [Podospora didyma]|uniref:DUF2407 C-terminal domain-containing protein n=1 Tax=Podospora didyma TaxID=330526 RepID=A0AAE0U1U3_9PEZI|nr:DUF2407 C-terminal domain-containing protein [Podospora didyma]